MLLQSYGWKANQAIRPNLSMIDYVLRTPGLTSQSGLICLTTTAATK